MSLTCYAYRLPFTKPLRTSAHLYNYREGWIFCWQEGDQYYFGEAAPLPGFSLASMEDIQTLIYQHIDEWTTLLQKEKPIQRLQKQYRETNPPPALRFALDSLAYQLVARRTEQPLTDLLFDSAPSPSITVNGLLSLLDKAELMAAVQNLVDQGFQTVKCKVGRDFPKERKALARIRKNFPKLYIRIDANRAWKLDEAIDYLAKLEPLDIQYCEEPLADPTADNIRTLTQETKLPLALDESIHKSDYWQELLPFVSILVIKPMLTGSFTALFDIHQRAHETDCALVFTSSLESSIGRGMVALLASGLGSQEYAHGLNTSTMLARDITPGQPNIQRGHIHFDTPSFPISTDISHLKDLSTTTIKSS